jgi:hypothetical protein
MGSVSTDVSEPVPLAADAGHAVVDSRADRSHPCGWRTRCPRGHTSHVERYARPAIAGTLAGSAVMNAFAFAGDASTMQMQIAGSAMGCAIPALIYCLTRIGAALYIDCHSRA